MPEGTIGYGDVLFEPNHKFLDSIGKVATEALVSLEKNVFRIPVENPQGVTVRLDVGAELGTVR